MQRKRNDYQLRDGTTKVARPSIETPIRLGHFHRLKRGIFAMMVVF